MKKILIIALAAGMMVSCDPMKDSGTFEFTKVNAEQLLAGATFAQFDAVTAEDGTVSYVPAEDGNYIQYNIPSVGAVSIFYYKADGSQEPLDYGKNTGMFYYKPLRGSEPIQTVYFEYIDADLTSTVVTKEFTLQVAQELAPADKLLCSNSGSKKWYWYPTATENGAVWGNGGYQAGAVTDPAAGYPGAWWGCGYVDGDANSTFDSQLNHSSIGSLSGQEQSGSYMVFNEDGSLTKYSPEGAELGKGKFKITDYDDGKFITDYGVVAHLETTAGAILWPWMINYKADNPAHVQEPTNFEVMYLTAGNLMLVYAPEGTGSWGECTWWSFGNWDDAEGFLTTGKWGWFPTATENGAVWGNGGYQAGLVSDPAAGYPGAWWGCGVIDGTANSTFDSQLQHSAIGSLSGQEESGSYMTFAEDGSMAKFAPDGTQLGEGKWAAEMKTSEYSLGTFKTTAGAILWPWMINYKADNPAHVQAPTDFEISYLSPTNLFLIYAPEGTGGWGECTWWSFGKLAE